MKVRLLNSDDEALLNAFLSNYIESSMFLLSNLKASGFTYENKPFHGEYIGSFTKEGAINGVLAHYWNGNIMFQSNDMLVLNQLITFFQKILHRPIAGIIGENQQAEVIISNLKLTNESYKVNRSETLLALDLNHLIIPPVILHSSLVAAKTLTRTILTQWLKAYEMESFGIEDNELLKKHIEARVDAMISDSDCWALMVDHQPVALCGFSARLPNSVQIGPVWTPTSYRNQGYARYLLASVLSKAKTQGIKKAILFTDHPAALRLYHALGFTKTGLYRLALLKNPIII